jgi:hypothetical protein
LVRDGCGRAVPFCTADGFVSKKTWEKTRSAYRFFGDNPVPIQAVVFRKELYQSCGGLDPGLDALEDWDLWMRMICQSPVWGIEKATSIFRVPADEAAFAKRDAEIAAYRGRLFQKMAAYTLPLSAQDVYGLFWQPKKNNEGLDREAWRIKAIGLTNSATWRATHILRRILRTLGAGVRKLAGPESVDFEAASAEDLYAYCIQVERISLLAGCGVHQKHIKADKKIRETTKKLLTKAK